VVAATNLLSFDSLPARLSPECVANLRPILRPFLLEDVLMDAPPHMPVKRDQPRIHRPRLLLTGRDDEAADVGQQRCRSSALLRGWDEGLELFRHTRSIYLGMRIGD